MEWNEREKRFEMATSSRALMSAMAILYGYGCLRCRSGKWLLSAHRDSCPEELGLLGDHQHAKLPMTVQHGYRGSGTEVTTRKH